GVSEQLIRPRQQLLDLERPVNHCNPATGVVGTVDVGACVLREANNPAYFLLCIRIEPAAMALRGGANVFDLLLPPVPSAPVQFASRLPYEDELPPLLVMNLPPCDRNGLQFQSRPLRHDH